MLIKKISPSCYIVTYIHHLKIVFLFIKLQDDGAGPVPGCVDQGDTLMCFMSEKDKLFLQNFNMNKCNCSEIFNLAMCDNKPSYLM